MVAFMLLTSLDILRFLLGMMRLSRSFYLSDILITPAWLGMTLLIMARHDFYITWFFSQGTRETITLPAPSLFNLSLGRYTIMPADIYAYCGLVPPQVDEPEPAPEPEAATKPIYQWDPQDPVYQWDPQEPQHYPREGYF